MSSFSPPGPGGASPPASAGTAGRAWQLVSISSVTLPATSRKRWESASRLRRPSSHRPCHVPLRPVTRVLRVGARAVRLAALAAHLVQRPPAEVPDPRQLPVQLLPPALEFRQLIRLFRHFAS